MRFADCEMHRTCVIADSKGTFSAMSVYNIAAGGIKDGDVLCVAEPRVKRIQLHDPTPKSEKVRHGRLLATRG